MLYAPWDKPVEYRVEYVLKPQGLITKDWQGTKAKKIVVTDPFVDQLNVTLVRAGNWEEVQQAVVSLAYEDRANNHAVDAQYELKSIDEFADQLRRSSRKQVRALANCDYQTSEDRASGDPTRIARADRTHCRDLLAPARKR